MSELPFQKTWLRSVLILLAAIPCMGTSCVRTVYSVNTLPLKSCPKETSLRSTYESEDWLIAAGKDRLQCSALRSYVIHSKKKDIAERLSEAYFSAGVVKSGEKCEWRAVLEVFCGYQQSLEDCKKTLPYQKAKLSMDQVTGPLHRAILDTVRAGYPDLNRVLDIQAKLAEPIVVEDVSALVSYCR